MCVALCYLSHARSSGQDVFFREPKVWKDCIYLLTRFSLFIVLYSRFLQVSAFWFERYQNTKNGYMISELIHFTFSGTLCLSHLHTHTFVALASLALPTTF
jgi:hypothetical protein